MYKLNTFVLIRFSARRNVEIFYFTWIFLCLWCSKRSGRFVNGILFRFRGFLSIKQTFSSSNLNFLINKMLKRYHLENSWSYYTCWFVIPLNCNSNLPATVSTAGAVTAKPFLRSISLNKSYAMCLDVIIEFTVQNLINCLNVSGSTTASSLVMNRLRANRRI